MKPFKLEIQINKTTFSRTFKYDFEFIDFTNRLNVEHTPQILTTVDECQSYIRKETEYKIVDFEIEEQVFTTISDALNNGMDINKLIKCHTFDHRTLQQKFTTLCLAWVQRVGSSDYGNDGRNEYSHDQCKKIVNFMKGNGIFSRMPLI